MNQKINILIVLVILGICLSVAALTISAIALLGSASSGLVVEGGKESLTSSSTSTSFSSTSYSTTSSYSTSSYSYPGNTTSSSPSSEAGNERMISFNDNSFRYFFEDVNINVDKQYLVKILGSDLDVLYVSSTLTVNDIAVSAKGSSFFYLGRVSFNYSSKQTPLKSVLYEVNGGTEMKLHEQILNNT